MFDERSVMSDDWHINTKLESERASIAKSSSGYQCYFNPSYARLCERFAGAQSELTARVQERSVQIQCKQPYRHEVAKVMESKLKRKSATTQLLENRSLSQAVPSGVLFSFASKVYFGFARPQRSTKSPNDLWKTLVLFVPLCGF
jgi:hypothetical protein